MYEVTQTYTKWGKKICFKNKGLSYLFVKYETHKTEHPTYNGSRHSREMRFLFCCACAGSKAVSFASKETKQNVMGTSGEPLSSSINKHVNLE